MAVKGFFIFILLLRGKYLLAVNTPSKNSLEFGRRAGWADQARARSRRDSESQSEAAFRRPCRARGGATLSCRAAHNGWASPRVRSVFTD